MKIIITALMLCVVSIAQAVEVTATGYGSSYDEALQSAKVSATENVASTFLTGKRELINGKYKETLGQYNGGLVQRVDIKSVTVSPVGVYKVEILADVNTDKVNTAISTKGTATIAVMPDIIKAIDENKKVATMMNTINAVTSPYAIEVNDTSYKVDGSEVKVTYHLVIKWNPKWIDDMKQFMKTANHSPDENTFYAVCMNNLEDCMSVASLPTMDRFPHYTTTVHHRDGSSGVVGSSRDSQVDVTPDGRWLYCECDYVMNVAWRIDNEVHVLMLNTRGAVNFDVSMTLTPDEVKSISGVTFELN